MGKSSGGIRNTRPKKERVSDSNIKTKEFLGENRESIISAIKWFYKIYDKGSIKNKMSEFLIYAQKNIDVEKFRNAKNTKTLLRNEVEKMRFTFTPEQIAASKKKREEKLAIEEERNLRMYGTKKPKLADLMAYSAAKEEAKGNVWNPLLKAWVKRRY